MRLAQMQNFYIMKTHKNFEWLIKKSYGQYLCCDVRENLIGKKITIEKLKEPCCDFFLSKKEILKTG